MVHLVEEAHHAFDVVEQRQLERLQFQGDLQSQVGGVLAQLAAVADADLPLLGRRDHLPLPDVFAQHQQQVLGLVFVAQVEVSPAALQVEPLHAGIEVDQADGDASDADDRQAGPVALALDEPAFLDVEVERIGEDVDGVEADLLGGADAVGGVAAGLCPGGIDEAEFHGVALRGGPSE